MNILRIYNVSILFTLIFSLALYSATGDTDTKKYAGIAAAMLGASTLVSWIYAMGER